MENENKEAMIPQRIESQSDLMTLAATGSIPVERLNDLFALQERIDAKHAKRAYNAAMVRAQANIKRVAKNKNNTQTKSKYADLEAVCDMATPVYTSEGLALSFYEGDSGSQELVRTYVDIIHEDGHTEQRFLDLAVDDRGSQGAKNKTAIHGKGSSFSYARRYLTCMIFNIPTGDDDDGQNAGKKVDCITQEQVAEINDLLAGVGADSEKFLKFIRCESVDQILTKDFNKAIKLIESKRKQREPGCDDE